MIRVIRGCWDMICGYLFLISVILLSLAGDCASGFNGVLYTGCMLMLHEKHNGVKQYRPQNQAMPFCKVRIWCVLLIYELRVLST